MNGQLKYACTNYLTPANRITEYHFNYPQSYTSKDSLIKLINKGVSFLNYTGHGDEMGWLHVNFKSPDVLTLDNKNMYPFVISNACRTSQFNFANTLGIRMVLTASKGAIGFIGCSNDSYWDEDFYWAVGPGTISSEPKYSESGLGAYDRMFHTHGETPSDWYFTMGQINFAGNMAVSASNSSRKKYYWETYNLIGDPSVIPILGKPQPFTIALPDTLPNGIKLLSLTTDPFSYVAVSHLNTLWDASYASASGSVSLDMPGLSNDSCLVVITGQNKIPVIKTIYFSNIKKEYVDLGSISINDSLGNNNHLADYGESVFLKLSITNLGSTTAQNLRVKVSSASPWINISRDTIAIGTLAAGKVRVFSDKLAFNIFGNVPDLGIATLDLMLKDNVTEKHYLIDICIHATDLLIVNCMMDDKVVGNGDFIPDPGETFKLIIKVQNQGSSDIAGKLAMSSPQEGITIGEPSVKSGVLKFGETTDIPILAKLSESVSSGSIISVSALLDCSPYLVNKDFSFRVGKMRESFEASSFLVFPWINISQ
ncbi:MAG TPA: C25 family cysteine peptidase, partial [Bacteroidales bacterium]|nr:C25 family cysteine peptidase [Bacteroidales bacterium]